MAKRTSGNPSEAKASSSSSSQGSASSRRGDNQPRSGGAPSASERSRNLADADGSDTRSNDRSPEARVERESILIVEEQVPVMAGATVFTPARRIVWGAIFAGGLVTIALQIVMSLLGAALGFAIIDPLYDANPLAGMAVSGFIWWVVTGTMALAAGGAVAGCVAERWPDPRGEAARAFDGALHGFMAWALVLILSAWLSLGAMGSLMGGGLSILQTTISATGAAVGQAASSTVQAAIANADSDDFLNEAEQAWDDIRSETEDLLRDTQEFRLQSDRMDSAAAGIATPAQETADSRSRYPRRALRDTERILENLFAQGSAATVANRDAAARVLAERMDMTQAEARQTIDRWIETYQDAKARAKRAAERFEQQAEEAAQIATEATAKAAFWTFVMLIFGALAATLAGFYGSRVDDQVEEMIEERAG
jgi:hypothetical protein